jgi:Cys-tRNA(Pro)/Cys-tRNA(Cys) deacylase
VNKAEVKAKVEKNNAMRVLDAQRIPYQVYNFPPEIHSAQGVAETFGLSAAEVYKTLVVLRADAGGQPMLVMAPGDRELDLKLMAKALGEKKLRMATQKEAEKLTGLQVGGISALPLLNRNFAVYIDRRATELSHVLVSAGKRGLNLRLAVADLIAVTGAQVIEAT